MEKVINFNWYPGHMAHTRRNIKNHIFKADLVIEILDARIPWTSRAYLLEDNLKKKKRIILLNKTDLADSSMTQKWVNYYRKTGDVLSVSSHSSLSNSFVKKVYSVLRAVKPELHKVKLNHKIIVVGIPNVGKSRFINGLVGKKKAKVENKPGVTRGPQWIKIDEGYELMDLPGVLAPSIINDEAAIKLALCNSMSRDNVDIEMCIDLLINNIKSSPKRFEHKFVDFIRRSEFPILEYAKSLNFISKGNLPDEKRAMKKILKDFDSGKFGKLTLDDLSLTEIVEESGEKIED